MLTNERPLFRAMMAQFAVILSAACGEASGPTTGREVQSGTSLGGAGSSVLLLIDEESIDNGNPPNSFSDVEVNDQVAEVGVRRPLAYFEDNVGATIDLYTGQVGDEGWHAIRTIPSSWRSAGPTDNGARNFRLAGPGLGSPAVDDDREKYLDKIPNVTPLRATGLAMLKDAVVCAVVYDSDVSINYSPLLGSLKGANLGIVGLEVLAVTQRFDGSTSDLPRVTVRILDPTEMCDAPLALFDNAPKPRSSSEPFDIAPPANPPAPRFVEAP